MSFKWKPARRGHEEVILQHCLDQRHTVNCGRGSNIPRSHIEPEIWWKKSHTFTSSGVFQR